jgi:hypothetical protein
MMSRPCRRAGHRAGRRRTNARPRPELLRRSRPHGAPRRPRTPDLASAVRPRDAAAPACLPASTTRATRGYRGCRRAVPPAPAAHVRCCCPTGSSAAVRARGCGSKGPEPAHESAAARRRSSSAARRRRRRAAPAAWFAGARPPSVAAARCGAWGKRAAGRSIGSGRCRLLGAPHGRRRGRTGVPGRRGARSCAARPGTSRAGGLEGGEGGAGAELARHGSGP